MPAAGGYLFRPYSGNGFLHLNPSDGGVTLSTSSGIDEHTWIMLDKIASLCNPAAGGFLTPASETSVHFVSGIAKEENWLFFPIGNNTFRILSEEYPGQCLAADATGCLCLTEATFSAGNSSQIWCLTQSNGGYTIRNEAYSTYLYAKTTAGGFTCSLDTTSTASTEAERVWTFMNYAVPEDVSMLSSLANPTLFLKNASAKDYNGQSISVGADERAGVLSVLLNSTKTDNQLIKLYGDKCAFRIVYDGEHHAYRIMPISSGNGMHRAIAKDENSNNVVLLNNTIYPDDPQVVDTTRLLFVIELQSDGAYVIKLQSTLEQNTVLVLTDNKVGTGTGDTTVTLSEYVANAEKQKWTFSTYSYFLPGNKDSTKDKTEVSYTEFENWCRSLGFGNPFGANPEISLVLTSDFGVRKLDNNPNDFHEGLDIRTKPNKDSNDVTRALYSPYSGKVVEVNTTNIYASSGLYVKIDTGIPAYEGSDYTICIVYIHMKEESIKVSVNDPVTPSTLLGYTGDTGGKTGKLSAHLHYGVFLHKSGESYAAYRYPLNPLMFFTPDGFVNGSQ